MPTSYTPLLWVSYTPPPSRLVAETLRKSGDRLHFVRVSLKREGDETVASSTGSQSSGVLRSMVLAQGLLVFPAEKSEIAAGERASVQVLDPEFFSRSESGL